MTRLDHYLTDQQVVRLKALADKTGLTVSEIIRRAVDEYLKREAKTDAK